MDKVFYMCDICCPGCIACGATTGPTHTGSENSEIVTASSDDLSVEFSIDAMTPCIRPGQRWLPRDPETSRAWLTSFIRQVEAKPKRPLADVLQKFQQLIQSEPGLKDLTNGMFNDVPHDGFYDHDPSDRYERVRDYQHMLELFNEVLDLPPRWDEKSSKAGMVGAPFNVILAWPMATPSGHAFSLNKKVNSALQRVLHE